jgi:VWFA-related protein
MAVAAFCQAPTFRAGVTDVNVDAAVTVDHRSVTGLQASDFTVFDEGQEQPIVSFGQESVPLDVVLLLDTSGSMQRWIAELAEIANTALRQLKQGDRVAVVAFSGSTQIEQPLTADMTRVAEAIKHSAASGPADGGTDINDAMQNTAEYLISFAKKEQVVAPGALGRRRAIVVITDNLGFSYDAPKKSVVAQLYRANTVVYGLVIPTEMSKVIHKYANSRKHPQPKDGFEVNDVFDLAKQTGGEAEYAEHPNEVFSEMLGQIRSRYVLTYHAPQAAPGTLREIRVTLSKEARKRYRKAVVSARAGYYVALAGSSTTSP